MSRGKVGRSEGGEEKAVRIAPTAAQSPIRINGEKEVVESAEESKLSRGPLENCEGREDRRGRDREVRGGCQKW